MAVIVALPYVSALTEQLVLLIPLGVTVATFSLLLVQITFLLVAPVGKTVAATDLLVPGVGEIIGGSEREADYNKLVKAMNDRNMNLDNYHDYLDLRKYGSVPHGGFGLGFERMIMYATGMANIRDVILYPRTVGNIR